MALKKYVKILGWDNLDTFYNKKINGVHITIENFDRVFCRCGETHASEGGSVHKCPKCGNTDFLEYEHDYYWSSIKSRYAFFEDETYCPFKYEIKARKLSGKSTINREGIEFEINEYPFVIFEKDNITIKDIPSSTSYYYSDSCHTSDIPMDLIEKWPYFSTYEKMLEEENLPVSISNLINVCTKIKDYGNCLSDKLYVQYPSLGKTVLDKILKEKTLAKNKDFSYYLDKLGIEKDLLSVYDFYEKKNNSSYRSIFQSVGGWRNSQVMYIKLQEYRNKKTTGYKMIENFVLNGMIDLINCFTIIDTINDLINLTSESFKTASFYYEFCRDEKEYKKALEDVDVEKLLEFYIKENISLKNQERIVMEFLKDIKTLKELGIKVCEENLKVRNMNYYLNKFRLAETYKLPGDKIECFIDWFETNPLKAIQLIENRRKISKKQLDEFLNSIAE